MSDLRFTMYEIYENYTQLFWLMWLLYVAPRLFINTHPPTSTNPNCLALEKKNPLYFLWFTL